MNVPERVKKPRGYTGNRTAPPSSGFFQVRLQCDFARLFNIINGG